MRGSNSPESMLEEKGSPGAVWMDFKLQVNLEEEGKNCVYCFFEGEDRKYYLERIGRFFQYCVHFDCNGRTAVIEVCERLIKDRDYNNRLLFFIDRDYNLDSYENSPYIYQTSEYSIENYYCKEFTIKGFLCKEVGMNVNTEDFSLAIKVFNDLKKEFISYYSCINIWYIACDKCDVKVKLDQMLLKKDFNLVYENGAPVFKPVKKITVETISDLYLEKLENDSREGSKYAKENLDEYKSKKTDIDNKIHETMRVYDSERDFRGKFLMFFLEKYLTLLRKRVVDENTFTKKYKHFYFSDNYKNILSTLSSLAFTPECLNNYLRKKRDAINDCPNGKQSIVVAHSE